MDPTRHLHGTLSCPSSGAEQAVLSDRAPERCGKARQVGKADLAAGDRQRVQRAERRFGAVAAERPRQSQLARVLAVELRCSLCPGQAREAGCKQGDEAQPFQHG